MRPVYAVKDCGSDCELGVSVRVTGVDLVCRADGWIDGLDDRWYDSREAALAVAKARAECRRLSGNPSQLAKWLKQLTPEVRKAMYFRVNERSEPPHRAIRAAYGWRDDRWVGPPKAVVLAMEIATDGKWRGLSPSEEHEYFIY